MASSLYARAAASDAVVVKGFEQLQRVLGRMEDGVEIELRKRIKELADQVGLVAAADAPRRTGVLQHSIKTSVTRRGASIYSNVVYGGAINYGAYPKLGPQHRGPHIKRSGASHYMDRAVDQTKPWVEKEMQDVMDWLITTFESD